MKRPCLTAGCPALTERTYCERHEPKRRTQRPYVYRPQYGGDWNKVSREQRRRVPYCEWCGSEDDLQADHIVPGSRSGGLQTLCRRCNLARRRLAPTAG